MGFFKSKSPEQVRAEAAQKLREEERRRLWEFLQTPAGQARTAREKGQQIFQIVLPLSKTTANVVSMVGAFTHTENSEHASVLDSIEAEGWRLEHVGYVYQTKRIFSRDKFLSSGQEEAIEGETLGIYLFRVAREVSVGVNATAEQQQPDVPGKWSVDTGPSDIEVRCPKCNAGLPAEAKFCASCGTRLDSSGRFRPEEPEDME